MSGSDEPVALVLHYLAEGGEGAADTSTPDVILPRNSLIELGTDKPRLCLHAAENFKLVAVDIKREKINLAATCEKIDGGRSCWCEHLVHSQIILMTLDALEQDIVCLYEDPFPVKYVTQL
jgi:hypothetical protein